MLQHDAVCASAPGSLMLLGEYAVLHGYPALVAAIDQRITVTLTPRIDKKITITSVLGSYTAEVDAIEIKPPFSFVWACLLQYKKYLSQGCDLSIHADFSSTVGFASSAAVTVATCAALSQWLSMPLNAMQLITQAREIIRAVQGVGSGADVAACVLGGVVAYCAAPLSAEKLPYLFPLTVVYSGSKTKTAEAIAWVKQRFAGREVELHALFKQIGDCAIRGIAAARENHVVKMAEAMQFQQGLQARLGVSTPGIDAIIALLHQQSALSGVKISGAGLGDCVIALGEAALDHALDVSSGVKKIAVKLSSEGVRYEAI